MRKNAIATRKSLARALCFSDAGFSVNDVERDLRVGKKAELVPYGLRNGHLTL